MFQNSPTAGTPKHPMLAGDRLLTLAGLALIAGSVNAAVPTLINLGVMPGGTYSRGAQVNANGTVVTGVGDLNTDELFGVRAFRWTASTGMQSLGVPTGLTSTAGNSISTTGNAVAGNASNRLFRWTSTGGVQNLGLLPGGTVGLATGISGDGSIVVGYSNGSSGTYEACRWTSAGGIVSLGTLPGGAAGGSAAHGISSDGSRIVGSSAWTGSGARACLWIGSGAPINLGTHTGGTKSFAMAISANNGVVVGDGDTSLGDRIFRWTSPGGMQNLGTPSGSTDSYARGTNYDGKVIAGRALVAFVTYRACLWTTQIGMVDLNTYLASLGVNMTGWTLTEAWGVSADGSAVSGTGEYLGAQRAFLVTGLPCPSTATIINDPISTATCEGSPSWVDLSIDIDAPGAVTYQWMVESQAGTGAYTEVTGPFFADPVTGLQFEVAGWNGPDLSISSLSLGTSNKDIRFHAVVTNPCGSTTSSDAVLSVGGPGCTACPADYNADGTPDVLDFLDFLDDFGTCEGQPTPCGSTSNADFNHDTVIDVLDFLDFLDAFGTGCD